MKLIQRLTIIIATFFLVVACSGQPDRTEIPPMPLVTADPNASEAASSVVEEEEATDDVEESAETTIDPTIPATEEPTAVVPTVESSAELTPGDCPFDDSAYEFECGTIIVPETRDPAFADDTNTTTLTYAVMKSESSNPAADPLVYLEGGPGGDTITTIDFFLADYMSSFLAERDVIFYSHRGSAGATPHLDCATLTEVSYRYLDEPPEAIDEYDAAFREAMLGCRDELLAEGANLASYNSAESAADVKDLLLALGYQQANFYGASYGTRLAQTIMRDHPEIVRSAVIDAVVPLAKTFEPSVLTSMHRAFEHLFNECATNASCNATYPDLRDVFYTTVDTLNETPVLIESAFDRYTGVERDVMITGDSLISGLFGSLYSDFQLPDLPGAIYAARDGDFTMFLDETFFDIFSSELLFSEIQHLTTVCYEDVAFDTEADFEAVTGTVEPRLVTYYTTGDSYYSLCDDMIDRVADPFENEAVASDIPTLLLSGSFDPITPPEYADAVAVNLSNSTHLTFPMLSHGSFGDNPCPESIVLAFVANPDAPVDSACAADMQPLAFNVPFTLTNVELEPYENSTLGIRGVAPVGWNEIEDGLLSPISETPPGIAYRVLDNLDEYLNRTIFGYYAYDVLPDAIDTVESNGLTWDLYKIEDAAELAYPYFAISRGADGSGVVIAILGQNEDERTLLFDQLFYQAINAFELAPISQDAANPAPTAQVTDPVVTDENAGADNVGDSLYPQMGNGGYDVLHYTLDLDVDVASNVIDATATIEATATQLLSAFNLDLRGLTVEDVTVDGVAAVFGRNADELTIQPATPLANGTPFTVIINYNGSPQPLRDPALSFTTIGWTEFNDGVFVFGEPSGAKTWYPSNNHPTDKATFTFRITTDAAYTTAATGLLTEETNDGDTITTVWEMDDPMASYLAAIYIGDFVREESQGPDGILIRNYFPPTLPRSEKQDFDQTAAVLEFYSELFGPYPFDVYGSIVVDGELGFALENQTLSIHGRDATDIYTIAHEIMHQWTGNHVSLGDWQDIWLNEGFAFYIPFLYLDETGQLEIDALMAQLYSDLEDGSSVGPATVALEDLFDFNTVYVRGGLTLYALHELVGDDAFREIMQTYYTTYAGGAATSADFIAIAESISGTEATTLLNQWLYQDELPELP